VRVFGEANSKSHLVKELAKGKSVSLWMQILKNSMFTAAVFLDIEKAFDIKWHYGLLYKLSGTEISAACIIMLTFFITARTFKVSVEDEAGIENRDYGCSGSATLTMRHPQKLTLTSPTSGGRSEGIVRSRTKATGLV
jgi:hypothetical protein